MPAAQLELVDVSEPVFQWRFDALVKAGFAVHDAVLLARSKDVDLHVATELVEHGCPPQTAVRILL